MKPTPPITITFNKPSHFTHPVPTNKNIYKYEPISKNFNNQLLTYSVIKQSQKELNINNSRQINQTKQIKQAVNCRLVRFYSSLSKYSSFQHKHNEINEQMNRTYNFSSPKQNKSIQKEFFRQVNTKNPQLYSQLPYQLVDQYIHSIYEEYHLTKPIQKYSGELSSAITQFKPSQQLKDDQNHFLTYKTPRKQVNLMENLSTTKKKIKDLKSQICLELKRNSLSNFNVNEQSKLLSQKNVERTQKRKDILTLKSKIHNNKLENVDKDNKKTDNLNLTTLSVSKALFQSRQKQSSQLNNHPKKISTRLKSSSKQLKLVRELKQSQQISNQSNNNNYNFINSIYSQQRSRYFNKEMMIRIQEKVSETFRYCFMCERPILQANIKIHEKECKQLNELLSNSTITKEDLLRIVTAKINRLQRSIEQSFMREEHSDNAFEFNLSKIKQKLSSWIHSIKQQFSEIENHCTQRVPPKRYVEIEYEKLQQSIVESKIIQSFENISRLNWFYHVRKNILKMK